MGVVDTIIGTLGGYADPLRNWALVIVPILSAWGTYKVARGKIALDAKQQEVQERHIVHTENIEQTAAMTEQFTAIMGGYQARVEDLRNEVTTLRQEVVSLRQALDRQRVLCGGCPKLPHIFLDRPYAPSSAPTSAPAT